MRGQRSMLLVMFIIGTQLFIYVKRKYTLYLVKRFGMGCNAFKHCIDMYRKQAHLDPVQVNRVSTV